MRIVGGNLRGRRLAAPQGPETRPTGDRVRETMFNILNHRFELPGPDTRALDLFAGSGALGLEAVSRGAAAAFFVETAAPARGLIWTNIEALELTGRTKIFRRDATRLGSVGTISPFNLVLADPPYGKGLGEEALNSAHAGGWLSENAVCVLEERADCELAISAPFVLCEVRVVGDTQLAFLRTQAKSSGGNR